MLQAQVWVVDFGSQYSQLIVRKTRHLGFSAELITVDMAQERLLRKEYPSAMVLSGGPDSVFDDRRDYTAFFSHQRPLLGICYGMQLMGQFFGGKVARGVVGEYGDTNIAIDPIQAQERNEWQDLPQHFQVWMSHADHVEQLPPDFSVLFKSHNGIIAGILHKHLPLMGLQFHPEVEHCEQGLTILRSFYQHTAHLQQDWTPQCMLREAQEKVLAAQESYVLCAFSGGVDSLVAAQLSAPILKDKLYCFFVDHGLLRPQDYVHMQNLQQQSPLQIEVIDAQDIFYERLLGVVDPEQKRKIIGKTFIEVFEQKVHQFEKNHQIKFEYLLQGTLYPDVIESSGPHQTGGKSRTIKSHHNVGGLPETMRLKLLEPLRFLFKDEVREIGRMLDLPPNWIHRHPFPGPGLGVRILGAIDAMAIKKVQHSDQILLEELQRESLYNSVWQAFTVLLPVKTVGIKGDGRAYEQVICVRVVNSSDAMTAKFSELPFSFLGRVSSRITNEVAGVTRVVYDITSKPPGTIEWE